MSESEANPNHENATLVAYQVARNAAGGFDSILVTLLTQGNTFVIAIVNAGVKTHHWPE